MAWIMILFYAGNVYYTDFNSLQTCIQAKELIVKQRVVYKEYVFCVER